MGESAGRREVRASAGGRESARRKEGEPRREGSGRKRGRGRVEEAGRVLERPGERVCALLGACVRARVVHMQTVQSTHSIYHSGSRSGLGGSDQEFIF